METAELRTSADLMQTTEDPDNTMVHSVAKFHVEPADSKKMHLIALDAQRRSSQPGDQTVQSPCPESSQSSAQLKNHSRLGF